MKRQRLSLSNLEINRQSISMPSKNCEVPCVDELYLRDLKTDVGANLPAALLARSFAYLTYLELSDETRVASKYQEKGILNEAEARTRAIYAGFGPAFAQDVNDGWLDDTHHGCFPKWLKLCGLHLGILLLDEENANNESKNQYPKPVFDLEELESLTMDSCFSVWSTFSEFDCTQDLPALKSFSLRQENVSNDFKSGLERFLRILPGLQELQVLLEGVSMAQDLDRILDVQGPSLRKLVWDEREARRTTTSKSSTIFSISKSHLELVSLRCPNLEMLGLSLDWSKFTNSTQNIVNKRVSLLYEKNLH